jgi:4-hydroxy-3-methylbut-2-enyl diphosphate reductase
MNTICPATRERQDALKKLCPLADGVLVIGGRNSANTKRLLLTAQQLCGKAALIETADEIPEVFFTLGTVGLTAGASTPDSVIDDVERRLSEYR